MRASQIHEDEPGEEEEEAAAEARDAEDVETPSQAPFRSEEDGDLRFYNPNQDPDQRRRLRASMRDHQRKVDGKSLIGGTMC